MNQKELKALMAKLDTKAGVGTLLRSIAKLNNAGRDVILRALSTEMTAQKKEQFLSVLRSQAANTDKEVRDWLAKGLTETYVAGMNQAKELYQTAVSSGKGAKLEKALSGKITVTTLTTSTALAPHLQAVNALLSDAYLDFGGAMTGYVRGAERILNDQLKRQLRSTIAVGRLEGESIAAVKKTVKETFANKGFTVLLDKSGKQWELERYSEMLARTHIIKANNEAVVNRASDFKVDIVEVSSHGSDDYLCASEEGKIYSISGDSENYPSLGGHEPPYHPNCRHTLLLRPDLR